VCWSAKETPMHHKNECAWGGQNNEATKSNNQPPKRAVGAGPVDAPSFAVGNKDESQPDKCNDQNRCSGVL
jgi:hypothetical protein